MPWALALGLKFKNYEIQEFQNGQLRGVRAGEFQSAG
jgi:hypothetical protein